MSTKPSALPPSLIVLMLLGGILPALVSFSSNSSDNFLNVVLSFGLCFLSALFLAKNIDNPRLGIYDFGFWVFTYVWMGFAPLVQFSLNAFPSTTAGLDISYALEAQFMVLLGIFGYIYGFRRVSEKSELIREAASWNSSSRIKVVAGCLAFISAVSSFVYINAVGFSTLFLYRSEKRFLLSAITEDSVSQTVTFTLGWVPSLVAGITFFYVAKASAQKGYWIVAFAALIPCLLLTNPISTARFVSITAYGGIILALIHASGKLPIKTFKIAFISSIFVLFPILNYFRNNPESQYVTEIRLDFVSGDYDAFAQIVNTVEYVHRTSAFFSDQFLGPILFWLPRQFWPDKPVDTGILLAQFKDYSFTNLSAPLWAEALISFSPIGLFFCFLFLGRLFARLDHSFYSNRGQIYASFFPGALYSLIIFRGSLLQATGALAMLLVSGYVVQLASKRTRRLSKLS